MVKPSYTMKIIGVKLDNVDYEKFEEICLKEEMTKSEVLRNLIKHYCHECEADEVPEDSIILAEPEADLKLESGKVYTKDGTWLGTLEKFEHKPVPGIIIKTIE